MLIDIISSARSKVVASNGYMYCKQKEGPNRILWKCRLKATLACKGSISTSKQISDAVVGQPHNHAPDQAAVEAYKLKRQILHRAKTTSEKPSSILASETRGIDPEVACILPSNESLRRHIRNQRYVAEYLILFFRLSCPDPSRREDLGAIPDAYSTLSGQPFLAADIGGPNCSTRILLFATNQQLEWLCRAETIFMDGNFGMSPKTFKQIYFFRVRRYEVPVTVGYALLPNKSRAAYESLFTETVRICTERGLSLQPRRIVMDFEDASRRAAGVVFGPSTTISGCFFHFTQAVWRKIQSLGMTDRYMNDQAFREFCCRLTSLAFLPINDVQSGFDHLRQNAPDATDDILAYLQRTYVQGRLISHQSDDVRIHVHRVPPLFDISSWNVHTATLEGDDRTNNICEGWNNSFRNLVGHKHPSIWKLLEGFTRDCSLSLATMVRIENGVFDQRRNNKTVRINERLKCLCRSYVAGDRTIGNFLAAAGHIVRLDQRLQLRGRTAQPTSDIDS